MSKKITYKALKIKKLMVAIAAMALSSGSVIHTSAMETVPVQEAEEIRSQNVEEINPKNVGEIKTGNIIVQKGSNEQGEEEEGEEEGEEEAHRSINEGVSKISKREKEAVQGIKAQSANTSINEGNINENINAPQVRSKDITKTFENLNPPVLSEGFDQGKDYTNSDYKKILNTQGNILITTSQKGGNNKPKAGESENEIFVDAPHMQAFEDRMLQQEIEDVDLSFIEDVKNYSEYVENNKDNYVKQLIFSDTVLKPIGEISDKQGFSSYTDYSIPAYSFKTPLAIYNDKTEAIQNGLLVNYTHSYDKLKKELKAIGEAAINFNTEDKAKYVNYIQQVVLFAEAAILKSSEIVAYSKKPNQTLSYNELINNIKNSIVSKAQNNKLYYENVVKNLVALNILMRLLLLAAQEENKITTNKTKEITTILSTSVENETRNYAGLIELLKATYVAIANNMRVVVPVLLNIWTFKPEDNTDVNFTSSKNEDVVSNLPELLYNYSIGTASIEEFGVLKGELGEVIVNKRNAQEEPELLEMLLSNLKLLYSEGSVDDINEIIGIAQKSVLDYHIVRPKDYIANSKYTATYAKRNAELKETYTRDFPTEYKEYLQAIAEQRIKIIPKEEEMDESAWFDNYQNMKLWLKFKELQNEKHNLNKSFLDICEVIGSLSSVSEGDYNKIWQYLTDTLDIQITNEAEEGYYSAVCKAAIKHLEEDFDGYTPEIAEYCDQIKRIDFDAQNLKIDLDTLIKKGATIATNMASVDKSKGKEKNKNDQNTMQAASLNLVNTKLAIRDMLSIYENAAANLNPAFTDIRLGEIVKDLNLAKQHANAFCKDVEDIITQIDNATNNLKQQIQVEGFTEASVKKMIEDTNSKVQQIVDKYVPKTN